MFNEKERKLLMELPRDTVETLLPYVNEGEDPAHW